MTDSMTLRPDVVADNARAAWGGRTIQEAGRHGGMWYGYQGDDYVRTFHDHAEALAWRNAPVMVAQPVQQQQARHVPGSLDHYRADRAYLLRSIRALRAAGDLEGVKDEQDDLRIVRQGFADVRHAPPVIVPQQAQQQRAQAWAPPAAVESSQPGMRDWRVYLGRRGEFLGTVRATDILAAQRRADAVFGHRETGASFLRVAEVGGVAR